MSKLGLIVRRGLSPLKRRIMAAERQWLPRRHLLVFLFHAIVDCEADSYRQPIWPYLVHTRSDFCRFLGFFRREGYRFISPQEIDSGEIPDRAALICFDDGYANNRLVERDLANFDVPASFCVATGHIRSGAAFWWDAAWRGARDRGLSLGEAALILDRLKWLPPYRILETISQDFGERYLCPEGDADRPLTEDELKAFAANPLITIGNHTVDHAILTQLSLDESRRQLSLAQSDLLDWLGKPARLISYPNGNWSCAIADVAQSLGLSVGVTVDPGANQPSQLSDPLSRLSLRRVCLPNQGDMAKHCANMLDAFTRTQQWVDRLS